MTPESAALLACLLTGLSQTEKCHADLVASSPSTMKEVKTGLVAALRADPGDRTRDEGNALALGPRAPHHGPNQGEGLPGETKKRGYPKGYDEQRKAEAAARELGRLGDWKALLALGSTTAAEGLAELENPPRPVLDALMSWSRGPREVKGRVNRRRMAAVDALKKYGPKAAPVLPELIKRLDSDDKRYDALIVIEKMGPAAAPAVPRLGELLKDKGWHDGAYSALRAIGTVEAQRLADDSPPWVVAPR